MKTIRTLMAIPFLLMAVASFCAMIFEFGKGVVTMSLTDFVYGFALLAFTFVMILVMGALNPNRKKTPEKKETQSMPKPSTDTVRAVIIPADPNLPVATTTLSSDLRSLQAAVGGYIEPVGRALDWVAWADEDGKVKGKPYNKRATHAMAFMSNHNPNDPIAGDVVVLGTDKTGASANVPNIIAGRVLEITGEIPA